MQSVEERKMFIFCDEGIQSTKTVLMSADIWRKGPT